MPALQSSLIVTGIQVTMGGTLVMWLEGLDTYGRRVTYVLRCLAATPSEAAAVPPAPQDGSGATAPTDGSGATAPTDGSGAAAAPKDGSGAAAAPKDGGAAEGAYGGVASAASSSTTPTAGSSAHVRMPTRGGHRYGPPGVRPPPPSDHRLRGNKLPDWAMW